MPPEEVVRHVVEENLWRDDEFIGQFSKEPPGTSTWTQHGSLIFLCHWRKICTILQPMGRKRDDIWRNVPNPPDKKKARKSELSTSTKIPFMSSFYGNCVASFPISTFMCLWAIYIFPPSVCLFFCREYVGPSWDYINSSQTPECGNWPHNSHKKNK